MSIKISIEKLKTQAYVSATNLFGSLLYIKVSAVIINLSIFIFEDFLNIDSTAQAWLTLMIILLVAVIDFFIGIFYQASRDKAEQLRKIQFDHTYLHVDSSSVENAYVFANSSLSKNTINEIEYDESYFENQNLKYSLLQNIFFTANLYLRHFHFYVRITGISGALIIVTILGSFAISTMVNSIAIELTLIKIVLFLIISFFTYNVIAIVDSFWKKSKQLKKLDFKLSVISSDRQNEIIALLIEYNTILSNAYPTFGFLYKKIGNNINKSWQARIKENANYWISILHLTSNFKRTLKTYFSLGMITAKCI